jgi:8-oxo-dGTP pyrophosphatase MutT (NUDIX family)
VARGEFDLGEGKPDITAAGGVVVRRDEEGRTRVAVIHRPKYGDWSLPKGKLDRAEPAVQAAVREVAEETGVTAVPQLRLPTVEYLTGVPGETKTVDFWSMRMVSDAGRAADDEITEARWVRLDEAPDLLSYAHDRGVLHAFVRSPRVTGELVLVRHAYAGSRKHWSGPDELRPVDGRGAEQIARLLPVLRLMRPVRVRSASALRCQQTVAPLGLPVIVESAFNEDSPSGTAGARAALLELARLPEVTVVSSQGKVIPPLLAQLRPVGWPLADEFDTPKGTGWLLAFSGTTVVGLDRLP